MVWLNLFLWWSAAWWLPADAALLPGPPTGFSVSGVAWRDDDVNGALDQSETLLSGVRVYLRRCGDPMPITPVQTTDMSGTFRFTGVTADTWQAVFQPPAGQEALYGFSVPSLPEDDETGITECMRGPQEAVNAGLFLGATVSGRVWLDADADGAAGFAEAGISGVVVAAACQDGRFQNETVTLDGEYALSVPRGDCYLVFTVPSGFVVSHMPANSVSNEPRVVSPVSAAADVRHAHLGLYPGGSVGDLVWEDRNTNGLHDADEPGLDGVTVQLVSCTDNSVVDTQTTNGGGRYWFTAVPVGRYRVAFQAPSARAYRWSTAGSLPAAGDASTGSTRCFPLGVGQVRDGVQAGFHQVGVLNLKVRDEADASGLSGLAVAVACQTFRYLDSTADDGRLSLAVPVGPCIVTFDRPANHVVHALPDDCRVAPTEVVCRLSVAPDDEYLILGMYLGTIIEDHIWQDEDMDGVRDPTEAPLPGITVRLYDAATDNQVGDRQTTDDAGAYRFTAVPAGRYYVQFEAPDPAKGGPTYHVGHPKHDDMNPTVGYTDPFDVTVRQQIQGKTARFYKVALLTSKVWLDADRDGRGGGGEGGVADVVVAVACQGGRFVRAMPTPASGVYAFAVPAGTCELTFSRRSGYAVSRVPTDCVVNASHVSCSVTLAAGSVSGVPMGVSFEICGDYVELPVSPSCTGVLQRAPHRTEAACYVVLRAAAGGRIGLRFTALDLGGLDGVYVWDGDAFGTVDAALVRAANSAIPAVGTSESSTVYIYWAAFGSGSRTGWSLNYYDATGMDGKEPPLCAAWTTAAATGSGLSIGMHPAAMPPTQQPQLPPQPAEDSLRCAVWEDTSADGVWDAAESGLPEVEISVTCSDFSASGETESTDESMLGVRTFSVPVGPCTVTFARPADYHVSSTPAVGCSMTDTEVICVVPMGANVSDDLIIGMYHDSTIQNRIYMDINGNGMADLDEPPLADVAVSLQSCDGAEHQTLTTDETGAYEFDVRPGRSYQLVFTAPSAEYSPASVASACIPEDKGQWQMDGDVVFQKHPQAHISDDDIIVGMYPEHPQAHISDDDIIVGMYPAFKPCGSAFAHPEPRTISLIPAGPPTVSRWRLPQTRSPEPQTMPLWRSEGQRIGTVTTAWPDPHTFVVVYHVDPGYHVQDDDHNVFIGTTVYSSIDNFPTQYEAHTMEHGSDFMTYTRDSTGDYTITVEGLPDPTSAARPYYAIIQASVQCSGAPPTAQAQARPYLAGLRLGLGLGLLLGVAAAALASRLGQGSTVPLPETVPCAVDECGADVLV
eukprot:EG_transcript_446